MIYIFYFLIVFLTVIFIGRSIYNNIMMIINNKKTMKLMGELNKGKVTLDEASVLINKRNKNLKL